VNAVAAAAGTDWATLSERNIYKPFGGGGPHFYLGANLARAEIRIMFDVIAERMPDITRAGSPRALRSMFINGIKELPVRYTA